MAQLTEFMKHLKPGKAYRRSDLASAWLAVDRYLKQATGQGLIERASNGLYYVPNETAFGKDPPSDAELVAKFLKGGSFLMVSPSVYNSLGVGTTQLPNKTVVYNRKRRGMFNLAGHSFEFRLKAEFPDKLSKEFLLVDLVDDIARRCQVFRHLRTILKPTAGDVGLRPLDGCGTGWELPLPIL